MSAFQSLMSNLPWLRGLVLDPTRPPAIPKPPARPPAAHRGVAGEGAPSGPAGPEGAARPDPDHGVDGTEPDEGEGPRVGPAAAEIFTPLRHTVPPLASTATSEAHMSPPPEPAPVRVPHCDGLHSGDRRCLWCDALTDMATRVIELERQRAQDHAALLALRADLNDLRAQARHANTRQWRPLR